MSCGITWAKFKAPSAAREYEVWVRIYILSKVSITEMPYICAQAAKSCILCVDETSVVTTLGSKQPADGEARRSSSSRRRPFIVQFHRHERTLPLHSVSLSTVRKEAHNFFVQAIRLGENVTPSHCRVKSAWTLVDVLLRPKVPATVCY